MDKLLLRVGNVAGVFGAGAYVLNHAIFSGTAADTHRVCVREREGEREREATRGCLTCAPWPALQWTLGTELSSLISLVV